VEVPALSCQAERSAPDGLVAPMVADLSSLAVHSDGCDLADCPACSLAAGPVGLVPDDLRSDDSHQDDLHPDDSQAAPDDHSGRAGCRDDSLAYPEPPQDLRSAGIHSAVPRSPVDCPGGSADFQGFLC
jgi:hypothetical protein